MYVITLHCIINLFLQVVVHDNPLVCYQQAINVDDTTLVLAEAGIQSGDDCVVSGCYEDSDLDSFLFHEVSCTIPREFLLCSLLIPCEYCTG